MAQRRWGGGSLVLWVSSCWALNEGGGALAAVLNEVQVMVQLPPWLLTAHLCTTITTILNTFQHRPCTCDDSLCLPGIFVSDMSHPHQSWWGTSDSVHTATTITKSVYAHRIAAQLVQQSRSWHDLRAQATCAPFCRLRTSIKLPAQLQLLPQGVMCLCQQSLVGTYSVNAIHGLTPINTQRSCHGEHEFKQQATAVAALGWPVADCQCGRGLLQGE